MSKKFIDRFLSKQKYITQDTNCIDKNIGFDWASKNIIKKRYKNLFNSNNFKNSYL